MTNCTNLNLDELVARNLLGTWKFSFIDHVGPSFDLFRNKTIHLSFISNGVEFSTMRFYWEEPLDEIGLKIDYDTTLAYSWADGHWQGNYSTIEIVDVSKLEHPTEFLVWLREQAVKTSGCLYEDKVLPLKIGLSKADKLALEETIYNRVVGQIEDITISGVRDNIQALRDEFPNGTGGIWVTKNDGNWNYYDNVAKDWVVGGPFIEEQEINDLRNNKLDKVLGNKKVYATDYQGGQTNLDYDVLPTPNTMVLRQSDGTIQSAMPKEDTDVATKKYVDSKVQSGGVNADALNDLIDNTYPDEITKEVNQDNLLEFHLDRHFVASLDQEVSLTVMRPSSNKQQWTLGGEEVSKLKGLRVWIKFSYNGNQLVLSHDIRFPTNRSGYQWFVSTPIPNPAIFSEKILVQYDTSNDTLSLNTTGGSISADTQIIEVKGIK